MLLLQREKKTVAGLTLKRWTRQIGLANIKQQNRIGLTWRIGLRFSGKSGMFGCRFSCYGLSMQRHTFRVKIPQWIYIRVMLLAMYIREWCDDRSLWPWPMERRVVNAVWSTIYIFLQKVIFGGSFQRFKPEYGCGVVVMLCDEVDGVTVCHVGQSLVHG